MGQVKAPGIPPPLGRETSEKTEGTVRKLVIEVDGVRHKQVADDPIKPSTYYCTKEGCSLYELCQDSSTTPCCINDPGATYWHYEKEDDEAPEEDVYFR